MKLPLKSHDPAGAAHHRDTKQIELSPRRLGIQLVLGLVSALGAVVGAAVLSRFAGLGAFDIAIILAGAAILALLIGWLHAYKRLLPLRKWRELTETTDLTAFEKANEYSPYMPEKIFERQVITKLWVMGNGCGKWSRKVAASTARAKVREIRGKFGGEIRFLASCPVVLSESDDEAKKIKARLNADSLLRLKQLGEQTGGLGEKFSIRTYKHLATLRLIILNDADCIVGHYKEDGLGNSLETPLMIFRRTNENEWGFGHAFHRLFDHEWRRAKEPTPDEWKKMEQLALLQDKLE
jgi:hypothetical protein